jgi:hypothetical protein
MTTSSRIVALVCTACGKRFANRWAYNQNSTNRFLEGTEYYTLHGQQAELVTSKRGNVATVVLRSAGPLRAGTQIHIGLCIIWTALRFQYIIWTSFLEFVILLHISYLNTKYA